MTFDEYADFDQVSGGMEHKATLSVHCQIYQKRGK